LGQAAKTYLQIVFGLGLSVIVISAIGSLVFAIAALVNVMFGLGWGYGWKDFGGGVLMFFAAILMGLFLRTIFRILAKIFETP